MTVAVQTQTAELTFRFAKETDNTLQFKEVVAPGKAKVAGTLYLQKSFTQHVEAPQDDLEVDVIVTLRPKAS